MFPWLLNFKARFEASTVV